MPEIAWQGTIRYIEFSGPESPYGKDGCTNFGKRAETLLAQIVDQ